MKQKPLFWLHRVVEQTSLKRRDLKPAQGLCCYLWQFQKLTGLRQAVFTWGLQHWQLSWHWISWMFSYSRDGDWRERPRDSKAGTVRAPRASLSDSLWPFHTAFPTWWLPRSGTFYRGFRAPEVDVPREGARWGLCGFSESWKSSAPPVGYSISQSSPPDPQVQGEGHRLHLLMKKGQSSSRACGREIFLWPFWENTIWNNHW